MIQVNELRVGNIIAKRTEVFTIKCATELVTIQRRPVPFNPVELNEEWLVRFGFEKSGNEWQGEICIEWDNDGYHYTAGEGVQLSRHIKYVHDLQNLVFALTGKELIL